jgi:NAD(P)-dependent dehydrogenase (short-subunit alcohol dehydrogenase family)
MFSFYISLFKSLLSLVFARLYRPQYVPKRDLSGQTAIVTGANSGIGLSIAIALAAQGANVHLACRNADRGSAAVEQVVAHCGDSSKARVHCRILDIGDLSSVRSFGAQWETEGGGNIDMLVHNAGIASPPIGSSPLTKAGLNIIYTTNFLGSFLLTHLLEPCLSPTARVVFTSSTGSYSATSHLLHKNASDALKASEPGIVERVLTKGKAFLGVEAESSAPAYGLSKAQQVLFAALLQQRFDTQASQPHSQSSGRTAHAFTPGFTSTPIFGKFEATWQTWLTNPLFAVLKTTEKFIAVDTDEGAKCGAWLAARGDELGRVQQGGAFWERMQKRTSIADIMDKRRKTDEWKTWERDAGIVWSV